MYEARHYLTLPHVNKPFLVQDELSGLRQLCQVGQQGAQVMQRGHLVEPLCAKDLHYFGQANVLLLQNPEHLSASLLVSREVGEDSTNAVREHVSWIKQVLEECG